jgi:hypothetical protein
MDNFDDSPNYRDLKIFKKALEINELVRHLMDAAPEGSEMLKSQIRSMLSDAMMIPPKIAGAEAADLYDLRMESAAIVRKAARDLIVGLRGLEMFGYNEPKYFDLLRREMEEFRLLFIDWVAGFDQQNYVIDRWGLFNPPGVSAHDHDPDDDIPFDPDALLGDDEEDDQ